MTLRGGYSTKTANVGQVPKTRLVGQIVNLSNRNDPGGTPW